MIGQTVGRYHIVAKLGQGGMGSVWKAEDTLLGRAVALKFLPDALASSADARHRFLREARAASALGHPGIATVYDAGEIEGQPYIAIAFVDGETVSERATRGPLPIEEAIRIAASAADALAHAHGHGVVHRDVSGRNIMIARDGRVIVLDFGLALPGGTTRLTDTGATVGTVAYIAPEVAQGREADTRSDLYSLGVVLYEMLTGALPFMGQRAEALLYAAVHEAPRPPCERREGVSPRLERLVLRVLEKDPARRPQSAVALSDELREAAEELRHPAYGGADRRRPGAGAASPAGAGDPGAEPGHVADRFAEGLPETKFLAVLPFRDLTDASGPDLSAQVFARGLAETVSASLARRSEIHVIPPSAASTQTLADENPRRIARDLGANLILKGTVQRQGDRVRIAYSLVQPDRGVQLAGDTLDGSVGEIFAIEDRLVESIIRSLALSASAKSPAIRPAAGDPAAHEHYLQALGYLQRFENEASVDGAIAILKRLADSSEQSAPVEAALGRAYLFKYKLTLERAWEDRAERACERAVRLDPRSAEVLVTLGQLHGATGRHADAARAFQRALKLRRDHPEAFLGLADAYAEAGKLAEAEQACRQAIALRPNFWGGHHKLGLLQYGQGQYERAADAWRRVVDLTPDNFRGYALLGAANFQSGRIDEAIAALHRSLEIQPNSLAYSSLGTVHFFMRNYPEAAAMAEKGAALRPGDPRVWGNLGDAYRWTPGSEERAAEHFDRAIELERERLRLNPHNAEGWADLAGWLAKRGMKREATQAIQRALRQKPWDVNTMATAVRVYHLVGARSNALRWLEEAVTHGYRIAELESDPELATLRATPAFQKLAKEGSSNRART